MQQHLDFVEPPMPRERVFPVRQQRVDTASGDCGQTAQVVMPGSCATADVPAVPGWGEEAQPIGVEVRVERIDQSVGGCTAQR